jgi:hypothetical protein
MKRREVMAFHPLRSRREVVAFHPLKWNANVVLVLKASLSSSIRIFLQITVEIILTVRILCENCVRMKWLNGFILTAILKRCGFFLNCFHPLSIC